MKKLHCLLFLCLFFTLCCGAQKTGDKLPLWQEGYLDIHHINTGCGECTYLVFPDGTTMMIDAGENKANNPRHVPLRPNDSRTPGEWIVDYINDMATDKNHGLDYVLLTHFHSDHMGGVLKKQSPSGKYYETGLITVAENLPVRKLVDRGFPDYAYLVDHKDKAVKNYLDFLRFTKKKISVEPFKTGRNDQFQLLYDTVTYQGKFEVRNIYSNGNLWTGKDTVTRYLFPAPDAIEAYDIPKENSLSCVLKINYGKFSYYTGGDVTGYPKPGRSSFHDIETPMAQVIGKTEVCCVNHHGYNNATNTAFISTLQPRIFIIQASDALHPNHSTLERMLSKHIYPGERDVFTTNLHPAAEIVIGDDVKKLKSKQGHIVIRALPGGDQYYIYTLEDHTTKRKIKSVFGPYECNSQADPGILQSKVRVASHRGDWRNYAENSIEAIESCIAMGVDIVEIDVARTKDGQLILMHDKTVDRTTNAKGPVSSFTLEEIRQMNLRNGLGRVGEFKIPTLEEAMLTAKDKITVNLDKADKYFNEVYQVLEKTGTIDQTIIKSDKHYEELRTMYGKHMDNMIFMPVIHLNKETSFESIHPVLAQEYAYYELVFEEENKELLLRIKDYFSNKSSVIWINSLWPSLCGGYSDDRALAAPENTWGYLIEELGARILQTDRPQYMLEYLRRKGQHK